MERIVVEQLIQSLQGRVMRSRGHAACPIHGLIEMDFLKENVAARKRLDQMDVPQVHGHRHTWRDFASTLKHEHGRHAEGRCNDVPGNGSKNERV